MDTLSYQYSTLLSALLKLGEIKRDCEPGASNRRLGVNVRQMLSTSRYQAMTEAYLAVNNIYEEVGGKNPIMLFLRYPRIWSTEIIPDPPGAASKGMEQRYLSLLKSIKAHEDFLKKVADNPHHYNEKTIAFKTQSYLYEIYDVSVYIYQNLGQHNPVMVNLRYPEVLKYYYSMPQEHPEIYKLWHSRHKSLY